MSFESYETDDEYRYPKRTNKNERAANKGCNWFCCQVEELPDDVRPYRQDNLRMCSAIRVSARENVDAWLINADTLK